jgi:spermidine/putrescine transport system ATP-binding protein
MVGRIELENIRKVFATPEGGHVVAVDDLSLVIEANEFFVMLGPSGCGKTTVLRAIAGLELLDTGVIKLDGRRIDNLAAYDRPVSTVFQSYALFPHMTVAQNIAFGLEQQNISKADIRSRTMEALEMVQLDGLDRRKPHQLSGGQQQRVALARSLAIRPKVLLLDEPLAALDLKLRREMQGELKGLQRETGITFVFVTHDQEEALALGDRIAVFRAGRLEQLDTPQQMYEEPANAFVAGFLGETNVIEAVVSAEKSVLLPGANTAIDATTVPGRTLVAIRPERLRISHDERSHLSGTITTRTYLGNEVRYDLDCEGLRIQVRQSLPEDGRIAEVGTHVGLLVDTSKVRFLSLEIV